MIRALVAGVSVRKTRYGGLNRRREHRLRWIRTFQISFSMHRLNAYEVFSNRTPMRKLNLRLLPYSKKLIALFPSHTNMFDQQRTSA